MELPVLCGVPPMPIPAAPDVVGGGPPVPPDPPGDAAVVAPVPPGAGAGAPVPPVVGAGVSAGVVAVNPVSAAAGAEETDFLVFGDVVNLLSLDVVSVSSSLFLCFNSDNLLREDPTLLGFKTDFEDRARVDIDLSGVTSESLSSSLLA